MSQIYLGDKIIASTLGSDIKYDENTSVNDKIDEHATLIDEQNKNMLTIKSKVVTVNTNNDGNFSFSELGVTIDKLLRVMANNIEDNVQVFIYTWNGSPVASVRNPFNHGGYANRTVNLTVYYFD